MPITIDDVIEESWNFRNRTGRYPSSVAMNATTFQHLSRLKDAKGRRFVTRHGEDEYAYLFGVPIVVDGAVAGVRFQHKRHDQWECEYCGVVWPTSIASVQCAKCGGLRSR